MTAANFIDQSNMTLGGVFGALAIASIITPNIRFDRMRENYENPYLFEEMEKGRKPIIKNLNFPAYLLSCALTFGGCVAATYGAHKVDILPDDHFLNHPKTEQTTLMPISP